MSSYPDGVTLLVIKVAIYIINLKYAKWKKIGFLLCSQNMVRIDEYDVYKFINPVYTVIFDSLM